jgi:hypothetical protein
MIKSKSSLLPQRHTNDSNEHEMRQPHRISGSKSKKKGKRTDDLCDSDNNYLTEEIEDSDFAENDSLLNEINADYEDGSANSPGESSYDDRLDKDAGEELRAFRISKRDIEDPYHELEYSEDDQKNYMGQNTYREKQYVKR